MAEQVERLRFFDVINRHPTPLEPEDVDLIQSATVYGAKRHEGQKRQSGEPYFSHPVAVAVLLSEMDLDSKTIAAGLLHDVVEDTVKNAEQLKGVQNDIQRMFGEEVLKIVLGVTKISKFDESLSEEERLEANYRNMIIRMIKDPRVILVKLADRLHNMRTLEALAPEKRLRIARETMDIYVPIAWRLGMGKIKSELEDLSFKFLSPDAYDTIQRTLLARKDELKANLERMEMKLRTLLEENGLKVSIYSRIKKPYSIFRKINDKGVTIDDIFDLLALRVVTETENDCFTATNLIKTHWVHIPRRYRDFISHPKPNKYQAIHLTVLEDKHPYEIQVRSSQLNNVAERGIAAHYYYKMGQDFTEDENVRRVIDSLREVIEAGENKTLVKKLKAELKQHFITLITPKGDFITLPDGSTLLDFAYYIHSNLGDRCKGGMVNNVLVKPNKVLGDWDYVKVETDPSVEPKKEWLHFVKSHKAIMKIKEHLNKEREEERKELGKKLISLLLNRYGLSIKSFEEHFPGSPLYGEMKLKSLDEFYRRVSLNDVEIEPELVEKIFPQLRSVERPSFLGKLPHLLGSKKSDVMQITGKDKNIVLGSCCNPLRGEGVFGYLTKEGRVTVHSQGCRLVARDILDPRRLLKMEWSKEMNALFSVGVKIIAMDVFGVLFQISKAFLDEKVNIERMVSVSDRDGNAVIKLNFIVDDIAQFNRIVKSIRKFKEIVEVERTK